MTVKSLAWVEHVFEEAGQLRKRDLFGHAEDAWLGATIDTRADCQGRIFFALRGGRSDGHGFLGEAMSKGSVAVVIDRDDVVAGLESSGTPFFLVGAVLDSLQRLAADYRRTLDVRIVAVTGSAGKTTTKEYIRAILKKKYRLHSSPGNFNNHIGVPLTILDTELDHEYLVAEIAANHKGEISFLAHLLRPDIGVVTNIGDAHIGLFGSREGIARAKAEIFEGIEPEGYAVLPADDDFLDVLKSACHCRFVTFGRDDDSTFRIHSVAEEDGHIEFTVNDERLAIHSFGKHNVENAAAAVAVAELCGVEMDLIREALNEAEPMEGRSRIYEGMGVVLIDDSYNANPTSMRAALEGLVDRRAKRRIAVLGDMGELGSFSDSEHEKLGAHVATLPVDVVFWLGESADRVRKGLQSMKSAVAFKPFSDFESMMPTIRREIKSGDAVLVKASRACGLDRVVADLRDTVLARGSEEKRKRH